MSQTAAEQAIRSAVAEMQALMRADGADLVVKELSLPAARLHLAVDLANVECLDCVVPPEMLRQVIEDSITKKYAGELEILIDDPRQA
ncbi:hypothetical protein K2X89_15090 [Myxococcota bacterium]|nr:hypothetical protein [Myxococcota bacterium]